MSQFIPRLKSGGISWLEDLKKSFTFNDVKILAKLGAYTSVIGKNKYQQMYKLSVHESASYVIGRRGLRCSEKISLHQTSAKLVKACILGTLEGKYQSKRIHNWVLWKKLKASLPAIRTEEFFSSLSNLKEFNGNVRCGGIPQQKLPATTDRWE